MSVAATICVCLAIVSALLFVYRYLIYPLVLRAIPPHRRSACEVTRQRSPSAALLFCAYNEEASLPGKSRISVCSGRSCLIWKYSLIRTEARTERRAAPECLRRPAPVIGLGWAGKVRGMQALVGETNAEVLVFTDANVIVKSGSLPRMLEYFEDPEIGCVAAKLVYSDSSAGTSTTARIGGAYWRLEEHIKGLESRSGSMMGADGSFFARRSDGYPRIPADLVDDMAASMAVLFDGQRCISVLDVYGFENSVSDRREEFRRKRRIACGSYSTYRYFRKDIASMSRMDRFKFYSHKWLRWWGALFLLAAVILLFAAAVLSGHGTQMLAGIGLVSVLLIVGGFFSLQYFQVSTIFSWQYSRPASGFSNPSEAVATLPGTRLKHAR